MFLIICSYLKASCHLTIGASGHNNNLTICQACLIRTIMMTTVPVMFSIHSPMLIHKLFSFVLLTRQILLEKLICAAIFALSYF